MMKIQTGAIILVVTSLIAASAVFGQTDDAVTAALVQAFRHGRAGALSRYFPESGRIRLAIAGVGIASGDYSAAQVVALLQQAFGNYETVSFALDTRKDAIRGDWKVKNRDTGEHKRINLYIAIKTHQNVSAITSIRGN